jgi:hypothetical protein
MVVAILVGFPLSAGIGRRRCRHYSGRRESRVLVEVRRDRRRGHQAVHDDSKMAIL